MAQQGTRACEACGAEMPEGFAHCDACGARLARVCGGCGTTNRPTARFCGRCGGALDDAGTAERAAVAPERPRIDFPGERKIVTVMFADVRGSLDLIRGLDPEEAGALLDPAVAAMVEAVRRYGGTVNRVQGDGIMALFGAPVAREDHAERACLAAWHLLQALPDLGASRLTIRVGINSGPVLIKAAANDFALDYDAIGEAAHLASRMEQMAAPGTALLSAATYRLAAEAVAAEALGEVAVKGVPDPVPVFRLLQPLRASDRWQARRRERSALTPFVGRALELAALTRALERARSDGGRFVGVVGEAGIGKSRLVHEFCVAATADARVVRTGAGAHDETAPYRMIGTLLRDWIGAGEAESQDAALPGFEDWLGAGDALRAAALRFLLDLPAGDEAWAAAAASERRACIRETMLAALRRAAAERPVVLVAEDLHWCDPDSREVLDVLVEAVADLPALIVTTSRPDARARTRLPHAMWLDLRGLEADEAEDLVRRMMGDAPGQASLRRTLARRTEGTPLFIEETVRMVLAAPSGPSAPSVEAGRTDIPDSVQAVIAARIDTLGAEARDVLRMAAVIGRDFPASLLGAVTDRAPATLAAPLRELMDAGFLRFSPAVGEGVYRFTHALTQAVAYEGMLRRHRQPVHARVLAALEATHAARLDEVADRLADHALHGGVPERAAEYFARAGRRANALGAHETAQTMFQQAIDVIRTLPESDAARVSAIEARLGMRAAAVSVGAVRVALGHLDEAESLARAADRPELLASVNIGQCNLLVLMGEMKRAMELGAAGHAAARDTGDVAARLHAAFVVSQAYVFAGEIARAVAVVRDVLPLIEANETLHGPTTGGVTVLCLGNLAFALALGGAFAEAHARSRAALRIAEATKRPYDRAFARIKQGIVLISEGAVLRAASALTEALRIIDEARYDVLVPSATAYLGIALTRAGRFDEACAILTRSEEMSRSGGYEPFLLWASAGLAELALAMGERDKARVRAKAVWARTRACGLSLTEAHALRVLAATEDRLPLAIKLYGAAARLSRRLELWPDHARARHGMADVLARAGRPRAAAHARDVALASETCDAPQEKVAVAA